MWAPTPNTRRSADGVWRRWGDQLKMQPEDSINPYASPKTTSLAEEDGGNRAPLRRPASVKWIIFVLGFYSLIISGKLWGGVSDRGFWNVMSKASVWAIMILPPVAFLLAAFGRTKTAHRTVSGILCLATCVQTRFAWNNWMMASADWSYLLNHSADLLISVFLVCLFYRFIFGRPAREYFSKGK